MLVFKMFIPKKYGELTHHFCHQNSSYITIKLYQTDSGQASVMHSQGKMATLLI